MLQFSFVLMWKLRFLGMTRSFNVLWEVHKIGESGTKKIFSEIWGYFGSYYPSLTNLDFFPILHFIGQSPDIGRQTQG